VAETLGQQTEQTAARWSVLDKKKTFSHVMGGGAEDTFGEDGLEELISLQRAMESWLRKSAKSGDIEITIFVL